MYTVIFSTKNAERIAAFQLQANEVMSVVRAKQEKQYFQFLHANQMMTPYPYPSNFCKELLAELGIDESPPENTTEIDLMMIENIDLLFDKAKDSRFLQIYIRSYFKRYHGAFKGHKGYPIVILSEHDDLEGLSDQYNHEIIDGQNCYSLLSTVQTQRVYNSIKKLA